MFFKPTACNGYSKPKFKDTGLNCSSMMFNPDTKYNSADSAACRSMSSLSAHEYDLSQNHNPVLCIPRAIKGSFSGPSINNHLMKQTLPSIGSETNNVSCNDLSEMMNVLNISQPGGISSFPTQQELDNLRALHELTNSWLYTQSHGQENNKFWAMPSDSIKGLDKTIRYHRNEATSFFEATCTWSGILPPRFLSDNPTFSCKVFLGGVPWDVTEESLIQVFSQFGKVRVDWPGKEQGAHQPKGYVYIILESEKRVRALLNCCTCAVSSGNCKNWFFRIQSRKMKSKEIQVIPWSLGDSNFVQSPSQKIDPQSTVFVGALHGLITAEGLFKIMNDLFGGVVYAGIDTDKFKYPIGSARVTFNNRFSYMRAIAAAFIEVKTPKFTKKLQVDPYLDDSACSSCMVRRGIYFCREVTCFRYFCHSCWILQHHSDFHRPLMRRSKTNST